MREFDPDLAVMDVRTMQDLVDTSLGSQTLAVRLLWIFAGAALLISIAGIYGLLAYNVSQRTRDIGLRMALGATRSNVVRLVLRQAVVAAGDRRRHRRGRRDLGRQRLAQLPLRRGAVRRVDHRGVSRAAAGLRTCSPAIFRRAAPRGSIRLRRCGGSEGRAGLQACVTGRV